MSEMDIRRNELLELVREALKDVDELLHFGVGADDNPPGRGSGRYPKGSGDNPYQRMKTFYDRYQALKRTGMRETEIAEALEMKTTQLRAKVSNAKIEIRKAQRAELLRLVNQEGKTVQAAANEVGVPWTTAKNMLAPDYDRKQKITNATAEELKRQVESKKYLDIGAGTEQYLGISKTKLENTVALLEEQGYKKQYVKVRQMGTGNETTMQVLTKDDVPWTELNENKFEIQPVTDIYTENGGETWRRIEPPRPVDSSRIEVNYTENDKGGVEKDGLIELRRGVDDISLGRADYAQVRIAVRDVNSDSPEGTNYMKGMAVYTDDLPDGIDIRYNTNKSKDTPLFDNPDPMGETVFKKMKSDPENPFGASIKDEDCLVRCQRHYFDENGKKQLSCINVVNEEGNWREWSKTLSSQFLSKQSPALAERQLGQAFDQKQDEFDEIMQLTNPTVKKHLLESFADDCDASASHLKAAALPGTASHVLIPLDIPDDQIYAPNYKTGDKVVLIRYPHAGIFEIPELTVNNNLKPGRETIGTNAPDAVGISHKTAMMLSGADFDGDTALVIPNNDHKIRTKRYEDMSPEMRKLREFDPSSSYPGYPGMEVITNRKKQMEMGIVSNLITDMTIKEATDDEITRAVKYSMVVIDAEKHKLNYQQAYKDFDIAQLKARYQGVNERGQLKGASTIISRASSDYTINDRKAGQVVTDENGKKHRIFYDEKTGEKLWTETGEHKLVPKKDKNGEPIRNENGKLVWEDGGLKTQTITKMDNTKDAYTLTSGGSKANPGKRIEAVYAEHANKLKALANKARLAFLKEKDIEYSPSARKAYAQEVASLDAKLNIALKNAPLERRAQLLANQNVAAKLLDNPALKDDHDSMKKLKGRALTNARKRVGSGKTQIDISDREWEAIQRGAISKTKLKQILVNADLDKVKNRAMPRTWKGMSPAKVARAKAMLANGHVQSEVAEVMGVSVSTLLKAVEQNGGTS